MKMPFVSAASPKMQTTFSSAPFCHAPRHAERGGKRSARVARAIAIVRLSLRSAKPLGRPSAEWCESGFCGR